ncbi:MAG TPA: transglutaminase domain-containing protein [Nevskiaceae bacterium]|nr:transglutaminase domain-containing protein [Nevskiaceae bacterium]
MRRFLVFFLILVAFGGIGSTILANDEFETNYDVRYQAQADGKMVITQKISLTNKLSNVYATQYSLTLDQLQIENIQATDSEGQLKTEISQENQITTITFEFNKPVVGTDKTLHFTLNYEALGLAKKNGQIWEVNIPRISNLAEPDSYNLTLVVPESFGELALIRPRPIETWTDLEFNLYRFTKKQIADSGINANFGQFQVFDFSLAYHLENPELSLAETEIALPPDTSYQQVFYSQIKPEPVNIRIDSDGNWLAKYRLGPKEKLNVFALGSAKIFSQSLRESLTANQESLAKNRLPQKYWPVDHPQIQMIAQNLKSPKEVYDYVVKNLDYDFSRVSKGAERFGALKALSQPHQAICMEFTDLFITLSRAAGIPAREINGFAYTTNDKLRPLSLVSDVLHAWPEYWDEEKRVWIPIDPTWGKTTGGIDYFSKIGLNHFTFIIHGENSELPLPPGSYKSKDSFSKDVQVVFGQYQKEKEPQIEVHFNLPQKIFWRLKNRGSIDIRNNGPSALYDLRPEIESEELDVQFLNSEDKYLTILPPFSHKKIDVKLKLTKLLRKKSGLISVTINNQNFRHSFEILSLFWLIIIIVAAILTIFLILFLTRRLNYVKKLKREK